MTSEVVEVTNGSKSCVCVCVFVCLCVCGTLKKQVAHCACASYCPLDGGGSERASREGEDDGWGGPCVASRRLSSVAFTVPFEKHKHSYAQSCVLHWLSIVCIVTKADMVVKLDTVMMEGPLVVSCISTVLACTQVVPTLMTMHEHINPKQYNRTSKLVCWCGR